MSRFLCCKMSHLVWSNVMWQNMVMNKEFYKSKDSSFDKRILVKNDKSILRVTHILVRIKYWFFQMNEIKCNQFVRRWLDPQGTCHVCLMIVFTLGTFGAGEWLWPHQPWWVKALVISSMLLLHTSCHYHFSLIEKSGNVFLIFSSLKGLGKVDVTHVSVVWIV